MGIISHRADSLVVIALQTVKQLLGINIMGRSSPWSDYIEIIVLDSENNNLCGLTQWANSLGIIALHPVKNCWVLTQ